jgi:transcription elongation factor Elf1
MKTPIPREEPDWSKRPDCPECGCEKVLGHGLQRGQYQCKNCGRVFRAEYKRVPQAIMPITPEITVT